MLSSIILFSVFAVILYLLLRPIVSGAMYFPAPPDVVKEIISVIGAGPGQKIADLGSGDGRIVVALAGAGADASGYEVNPILVAMSKHRVKNAGLGAHARVYWKSFWREDLSGFDAIVIYGYPKIMGALEEKISREMKPGAKIISLVYPLPNRTPAESRRVGGYVIRLYVKK